MTPLDRIIASLRGDADIWPADTDWNDVLTIAERHGVAMQLAHAVPNDVLRAWSRTATERAFHLARQLRVVVGALNAAGIEVLPIKGPILAITAYGDPARRGVSGDLDLVVRLRDFERALACLLAIGYVRHEGASDAEHEHEQWLREAHFLPPTLPAAMIELHTDLVGNANTTAADLDDVFARSRVETMFGVAMRMASAEDLLLYLCLHGARHLWSRLRWVCDVDALIRRTPSIDWQAVVSRAAAIDATQRLALGLHLAQTMFATPLPASAGVAARIRRGGHVRPPLTIPSALATPARRLQRTTALVARRMDSTSAGRIPAFGLLLASELAVRETFSQRLTYLRAQLTPTPRDRAWVRLPRHLEWLHVLLRPLRLLTRYGNAYELRR